MFVNVNVFVSFVFMSSFILTVRFAHNMGKSGVLWGERTLLFLRVVLQSTTLAKQMFYPPYPVNTNNGTMLIKS